MNTIAKEVGSLTIEDLESHPVWKFARHRSIGETAVQPVRRIPVADLEGKLVGTKVLLRNGESVWSLIGNITLADARFTQHFLTLSLVRDGKWFHMARYHDPHYREYGPTDLARFLELSVTEVFPISYDIRPYVIGNYAVLTGEIPKEPKEKLTRSEVVALAVP